MSKKSEYGLGTYGHSEALKRIGKCGEKKKKPLNHYNPSNQPSYRQVMVPCGWRWWRIGSGYGGFIPMVHWQPSSSSCANTLRIASGYDICEWAMCSHSIFYSTNLLLARTYRLESCIFIVGLTQTRRQ